MKTITVNVPFAASVNTDGNGFSYINDSRLSVSGYMTDASAPKKLREILVREVNSALDNSANRNQRLLATNNGHIFVVSYNNGWAYYISGPGRKSASSCHGSDWRTIEDCLTDARKHINSAFDGIAWECAI